MTDRYAVMGNPIAHSKSPFIHAAFAEQLGHDIEYVPLLVAAGTFAQRCAEFFRQGGCGLNITVPFKQEAFAYADVVSERAKQAGSVNTLLLDEQAKVIGDNTDGAGIVRDIVNNLNIQLESKRLLILGAGGAVRGVIGPLLEQRPAAILIANRTEEKAEQLVAEMGVASSLSSASYAALEGQSFDLIINGTSASLGGQLPAIPESLLVPETCCYDMMYSASTTAFNKWANELGVKATFDGLGMLVEQAAESYFIWRGVRPETAAVIRELRAQLSAGG